MELEKRATFGWPATTAPYAPCTNGLVVHYDGSNQGLAGKPHSACRAYWDRTRDFHMRTNGWRDVGYAFACCPHGIVMEGRGWQREQAAQPGGNTTWTSVTFMSGPSEAPTAAQLNAFKELRAWLRSKGLAAAIRGHRDFISTSCPGDKLYALVRNGGLTGAPTKEDDMPTPKDLWTWDGIPAPEGPDGKLLNPKNPKWQPASYLKETYQLVRQMRTQVDAQNAAIRELATALAARDEQIDVDALVARIGQEIEKVTVRLDVAGSTEA